MPDLINHLEVYIEAQKGVGFNAFVFSSGIILASILLYIYGSNQLATVSRMEPSLLEFISLLWALDCTFHRRKS